MKYKKIIIVGSIVSFFIITAYLVDFSSIMLKLTGHNMKNMSGMSEEEHNTTSHSSHDSSTNSSVLNKLEIDGESLNTVSVGNIPNINTPQRKKDPELTNVTFIDYVVNPTDTLWKISRTYMPNYPAQDTEETLGIISFIAEKNNLEKGSDGNFIIKYGQKLSVPAQLSIVSNVTKATGKKVSSTNTTKTVKETTNAASSSNNTTNSTNSDNNTYPSPSDHTSHTSH